MRTATGRRCGTLLHAGCVVLAAACAAAAPAAAQTPAPREPASDRAQAARREPPSDGAATDPIRCWWRTDRSAIRIGERFTITLTCGVIETGSVTVVPNVTQLDPGAVGLTPYEVLSGDRHDDLRAPPWRYIQYEYQVRLLGDGFFGQDVPVPPLTVTYNIQQGSGGPQGRDLSYVLPALPMRVISLVPRAAVDIRDSSLDTFGGIESRRFRSSAMMTAAGIFFGFAGLLVVLGLVRAAGGVRARAAAAVRPLRTRTLLRACARELAAIRAEARRGGWTSVLARRAAAALRVAAAVALGRSVAERRASPAAVPRDGQLLVRHGPLGRKRTLVSAPTTPEIIAREAAAGVGASVRSSLATLQDALRTLTAAGYGRDGHVDAAALEAALDQGAGAIRRMRTALRWPARLAAPRIGRTPAIHVRGGRTAEEPVAARLPPLRGERLPNGGVEAGR